MEGWGISSDGWRKGPWTPQEDKLLVQYVNQNGEGRWSCVSKCTGLKRSGKSCRLRWVNYLRPGLKKGHLSPQEEGIIMELHALWGNRWSTIARYLPGRTDNEIKNYWRTHFTKRKASETKQKQQRNEEETDSKNTNESPQSAAEATSSPQDTDIGYRSSVENHGVNQLPVAVSCQDNTALWSDFTPADCYLWGGIWNWDDQNDCSSRMVGQNQVDVAGYFGEGDAVDYAKNEGNILF